MANSGEKVGAALPGCYCSGGFLSYLLVLLKDLPTKVQIFWEGHENVLNRPYCFDVYEVNFKTINPYPAHIFVAFSEKLNFMWSFSFKGATGVKNKCVKLSCLFFKKIIVLTKSQQCRKFIKSQVISKTQIVLSIKWIFSHNDLNLF